MLLVSFIFGLAKSELECSLQVLFAAQLFQRSLASVHCVGRPRTRTRRTVVNTTKKLLSFRASLGQEKKRQIQ